MPSINLRLTDEQHADLERWATDGHRSLQKEIIFRLFATTQVRVVTPSSLPPPPDLTVGAVDDVTEPMTEYLKQRPGLCGMNVPAGTKCKVCGKVHPRD